jgi:hypothetical protein
MSDSKNDNLSRVASSYGTTLSPNGQHLSASCDHLRDASAELRTLIEARPNDGLCQLGGRAAEIHHAKTFMADAAMKGNDNLSVKIGPSGGLAARGSADLTVIDGGAKPPKQDLSITIRQQGLLSPNRMPVIMAVKKLCLLIN